MAYMTIDRLRAEAASAVDTDLCEVGVKKPGLKIRHFCVDQMRRWERGATTLRSRESRSRERSKACRRKGG